LGEYFIYSSTAQVITRLYVNKALFAKWIPQNTLSRGGDEVVFELSGYRTMGVCKTQVHFILSKGMWSGTSLAEQRSVLPLSGREWKIQGNTLLKSGGTAQSLPILEAVLAMRSCLV